MGEIIKKLKEIDLDGVHFCVELNHAASPGGEREVHIQNDSFRIAIPESEFLRMCASILLAKKQLEQIKGAQKLDRLKEDL